MYAAEELRAFDEFRQTQGLQRSSFVTDCQSSDEPAAAATGFTRHRASRPARVALVHMLPERKHEAQRLLSTGIGEHPIH